MYLNHHYHEQGSSSLTPRTSIGGDGDIPGMPRSGKKKSIFLDTKPSLDKRPSYGGFTTGQNKIGQGSELHPGSKQAFVDDGDEVEIYSSFAKRTLICHSGFLSLHEGYSLQDVAASASCSARHGSFSDHEGTARNGGIQILVKCIWIFVRHIRPTHGKLLAVSFNCIKIHVIYRLM